MKQNLFKSSIAICIIICIALVSTLNSVSAKATQDNIEEANQVSYDTYVVELLNSLGYQTTIDDWRNNLDYLQKNYNEIMSLEHINKNLVDYYIMEYNSELELERNINVKNTDVPTNKSIMKKTASYNRKNAVSYALQYYYNYNPNYPNWSSYGGDCANFVSQCLVAGGEKMVGTPGTSNAQNPNNWFSYGNKTDTSQVSSTFRGANVFKNYFYLAAKRKRFFLTNATKEDLYNFASLGDAVSFCKKDGNNYIAKHTMVVVKKDSINKTVYLAAHSSSVKDAILYDKIKSYDACYIFSMK